MELLMKRLTTTIILTAFCIGLYAQTATPPDAGNGSAGNAYEIASLENLYWIAESPARWNYHYIQIADIDATATIDWFAGQGWSPIGYWLHLYDNQPFTGSYDGQEYIIDGLFINRPETSCIGLFGYLQNANLENIGVTNADITGLHNVAGLTGMMRADSTVSGSYATGSINGMNNVGGIAGFTDGWNCEIDTCYSTGSVTGGSQRIGGLIGSIVSARILNSYSTMDVSGTSYVGGLAGSARNTSRFTNSYSSGNVSGDSLTGGLIGGYEDRIVITNCFYNFEEVLINGEQIITTGALDSTLFNTWLANDLSLNITDYLSSSGEYYLLESFDDLSTLLAFGQFDEYRFLLNTDLDLGSRPGFYIPYFLGEFNGNGHTIANLNLNRSFTSYIGLFGWINGARIENLILSDVDVTGYHYVGGLVGFSNWNTVIDDCHISGSISGIDCVGAMTGWSHYLTTISNSSSSGTVVGNDDIGGLVGLNHALIIDFCHSLAEVNGNNNVGGLIGRHEAFDWISGDIVQDCVLSNSYSAGNVTASGTHAGGLVGYQICSNIIDCYSRSDVAGNEYVGGLVGHMEGFFIDFGTVYISVEVTIDNSYSTGSVSGNTLTGGLVGYSGEESFVTASYWDTETSNQATSYGGFGRTTAQMSYPYADNTFVDWDFQYIWAADEDQSVNDGYPFLREPVVSVEEDLIISDDSFFMNNYPNPFNPSTTIRFSHKEGITPLLTIYNIRGQKINSTDRFEQDEAGHYFVWDGRNRNRERVASGVYFAVISSNGELLKQTRMLLLK